MADIEARNKAKRIVSQRNLGGLANDTKWREFFTEIARLRIPLDIKIINEDEVAKCRWVGMPSPNYVEGSETGPYLFVYVEWVRSNAIQEVSEIANSCGLECKRQDDTVTVYGYR